MCRTAIEKVDEYWSKVDAKKRSQRFAPGSAKEKAYRKRLSRASEEVPTPAKRGRSSITHTVASDDEEEPDEKPQSKRKARQSGASVASASKKAKTAAPAESESEEEEEAVEKPKKKSKKAKSVEPREEEEQEEPAAKDEDEEILAGEGYDGGRVYENWEDLKYAKVVSWEVCTLTRVVVGLWLGADECDSQSLVEMIETVEQEDNGIKFHIVW